MLITLYKTDDTGNIHYYTIHDRQANLFRKPMFIAIWGPALNAGREKIYTFESQGEMELKLRKLFRQRIKQGYRILYSYTKQDSYGDMIKELEKSVAG